jgi:acyl-CoA thioesterase II
VTDPVAFRDLMNLSPVDKASFRSPAYPDFPATRLFGGQLLAQALWAAGQLAPAGLRPHSLHAYFLRSAASARPVDYQVTELKQGRNLSVFRADAVQDGLLVFTLSASFEAEQAEQAARTQGAGRDGPASDRPAAPLPPPADCFADPGFAGSPLATFPATDSFEIRFARPPSDGPRAFQPCWVRSACDLSADPLLSACALAFISDMGVLSGCVPPGEAAAAYGGASLDHDLRFGQVTRIDQWHAFDLRPVLREGRRGLGQGSLRTADGAVAAVVAQEGFFPLTSPPAPIPDH